MLVLVPALVLAGAGYGAWRWLDIEGLDFLRTEEAGPSYPDAWDERVEELAEFVEDQRDLDFEHPVHVDFLPDEEFEKQVTADEQDLTDEDREEIEQFTGMLRALGVVHGDLDLLDAVNDLSGSSTLGYYDFEDKRIRMRGEKVNIAVRATLVHELTHALQDQHFDLQARSEEHEKLSEERDNDGPGIAWRALIEGDANRIEEKWTGKLNAKQRNRLDQLRSKDLERVDEATVDVPAVVSASMASPYAFGGALLELAVARGGNDAVDELFRQPPLTEEHIFDPWTLLLDKEHPVEVDPPELVAGEKEFDTGIIGPPFWAYLLSERVAVKDALAAADGWGGDTYVAFERDGTTCVRIQYHGDTAEDVREMRTQLQAWIAAGPQDTTSVTDFDGGLRLESCDPGTEAPAGRDAAEDVLTLIVSRTYIGARIVDDGAPAGFARCYADGLVKELTAEQIAADELPPAVMQQIQQIATRCR